MTFLDFLKFDNFGIICLGPKQSSSHMTFVKTELYDGGILINVGNMKIENENGSLKSQNISKSH